MSDFDLDHFPTSETAQRMLSRVSPIYSQSYVAKWLYQILGSEMDEAKKVFNELRYQRFVDTVTWGIEYQEYKYSIKPDSRLTLEQRRARLRKKRRRGGPLNPFQLEKHIRDNFGVDTLVDEKTEAGVLHINMEHENQDMSSQAEMYKEIVRIKPSHLAVTVGVRDRAKGTIHHCGVPLMFKAYHVGIAQVHDTTIPGNNHMAVVPHIHKAYHVAPAVIHDTVGIGRTYTGGGAYIHKRYRI